jgi:hypothetical protein
MAAHALAWVHALGRWPETQQAAFGTFSFAYLVPVAPKFLISIEKAAQLAILPPVLLVSHIAV